MEFVQRLIFIACSCSIVMIGKAQRFYDYPILKDSVQSITKFGVSIDEHYSQLSNLDNTEVQDWLEKEKKITDSYRKQMFAQYSTCEQSLALASIRWQDDGYRIPHKKHDLYFSLKSFGDGAPSIMYKRGLKHAFIFLCATEPFRRSKDDHIFVRDIEPANDNNLLAISISHSGSDWKDIRFYNIEKKTFINDSLLSKYGTVFWQGDSAVFYAQYKETGTTSCTSLVLHKVGDNPLHDITVVKGDSIDIKDFSISKTDSQNIMIINYSYIMQQHRVISVGYINTDSIEVGIHEFIKVPYNKLYTFDVLNNNGNYFFVHSTFKASNGKIVKYDGTKLNSGYTVIEEFAQQIRHANILRNRIFCVYYNKGRYVPAVFDLEGNLLKKLDIPDGFTVNGFSYTTSDSTTLYSLSSYQAHTQVLGFDFKNLVSIIYNESASQLFSTGYKTELIYYKSKDSVEIPMYITYGANLKPQPNTPALIYAYGGFGINTEPYYNPGFRVFMDEGGIIAVPLIRGGGELGSTWHADGAVLNKQNSFNDFIAAAEYLIEKKYTSPSRIVIHGGSNGGLLVTAVMVQRPELFKVVVPAAAVTDLVNMEAQLRPLQIGIDEYGDPSDSIEFTNLFNLSPLHHLNSTKVYPAVLMLVSDNDDRVFPINTYKFIAKLQACSRIENPCMMDIQHNQGHVEEGTLEDFQQLAFMYAFIFKVLGINVNKLK